MGPIMLFSKIFTKIVKKWLFLLKKRKFSKNHQKKRKTTLPRRHWHAPVNPRCAHRLAHATCVAEWILFPRNTGAAVTTITIQSPQILTSCWLPMTSVHIFGLFFLFSLFFPFCLAFVFGGDYPIDLLFCTSFASSHVGILFRLPFTLQQPNVCSGVNTLLLFSSLRFWLFFDFLFHHFLSSYHSNFFFHPEFILWWFHLPTIPF